MLAALCLSATALSAEKTGATPDFTGVWTNGGAAGIGGATNANAGALPFTADAQKRVAAFQKLTAGTDESPGRWCTGTGMPGSMLGSGGYPMEIVQRPEEIVIIYEAHSETRRVYFGARNAPEKDRVPDRGGYSTGHWKATRWSSKPTTWWTSSTSARRIRKTRRSSNATSSVPRMRRVAAR
ncbi:MAG: hypothetical protein WDO12_02910 [Pseudomonadota bacterium]